MRPASRCACLLSSHRVCEECGEAEPFIFVPRWRSPSRPGDFGEFPHIVSELQPTDKLDCLPILCPAFEHVGEVVHFAKAQFPQRRRTEPPITLRRLDRKPIKI